MCGRESGVVESADFFEQLGPPAPNDGPYLPSAAIPFSQSGPSTGTGIVAVDSTSFLLEKPGIYQVSVAAYVETPPTLPNYDNLFEFGVLVSDGVFDIGEPSVVNGNIGVSAGGIVDPTITTVPGTGTIQFDGPAVTSAFAALSTAITDFLAMAPTAILPATIGENVGLSYFEPGVYNCPNGLTINGDLYLDASGVTLSEGPQQFVFLIPGTFSILANSRVRLIPGIGVGVAQVAWVPSDRTDLFANSFLTGAVYSNFQGTPSISVIESKVYGGLFVNPSVSSIQLDNAVIYNVANLPRDQQVGFAGGGQLQLELNGTPVSNAVFGTATTGIIDSNFLISTSIPNSVVSVINPSDNQPIVLSPLAGGLHGVTRHLVISLLSDTVVPRRKRRVRSLAKKVRLTLGTPS